MKKWKNLKRAVKVTKAARKLSKASNQVPWSVTTMRYHVGAVVIRLGETIQGPAAAEGEAEAAGTSRAGEAVRSLKNKSKAKQEESGTTGRGADAWNVEEEYDEWESGNQQHSASQPVKKKTLKKAASA